MSDLTYPATVIGTDNIAPRRYSDGEWRILNMNQVYLGLGGTKKYVPEVGYEIHEIIGRTITRFIVMSVNEETCIPTMQQENPGLVTPELTSEEVLFGVGTTNDSETYRAYIDKSVIPHRLGVDRRYSVLGSECTHARIFKGSDVGPDGIIVSGYYNSSGDLVSTLIPLEVASKVRATMLLNNPYLEVSENYSVKVIPTCYTTYDLVDAERLTVVFYSATGFEVYKRQFLTENTAFYRPIEDGLRYVLSIHIESPFISSADDHVIMYPLNVPLNAINLVGVVTYSDGKTAKMPVDGTRFEVAGLEAYAATVPGRSAQLVLKYKYGANEAAFGSYSGGPNHFAEIYTIKTDVGNGNSYAVKLYGYPVWVDATVGYRMEWYLYDFDRSIRYVVTNHVLIDTAVQPFDGKDYGVKQTLAVTLNLRLVNGTYRSWVHEQYVDVTLTKPGTGRPNLDNLPNWTVASNSGETPEFGNDVYATYIRINSNSYKVRVSSGASNLGTWLAKMYAPTHALFDENIEVAAPAPTHFSMKMGNTVVEYPIANWNADLMITTAPVNNSTVFLRFVNRTVDGDLELSVAGLSVFLVDVNGLFV